MPVSARASLLFVCSIPLLLLLPALSAHAAVDATPAEVSAAPGDLSEIVTVTITNTLPDDAPDGVLQFDGLPSGITTEPSSVAYAINPFAGFATASFRFRAAGTTTPGSYAITVRASGTSGSDVVNLTVLAPPDLAVSLANPSLSMCAGAAPSFTSLTISPSGSYSGTPTLQWIGVPAGVTITPLAPAVPPLPPAQTIPFSVSATELAAGVHVLTLVVRDVAESIEKSVMLTLNVTNAALTPALAPAALTLVAGTGQAPFTASVLPNECLSGPVTIQASSLPAGVTMTPAIGMASGPPYAPVAFALTATPNALPGTSTIEIAFTTLAGLRTTAALALTIVPAPDFAIHASPPSLTIAPGGTAATQATLVPLNGFTGTATVTTTSDPDLTVTPASFTLDGSSPRTLQITASPSASPRTAILTLQAQSPGVAGTRTATVSVTISPRPDFALAVTPPAVSVRSGGTASVVVTMTAMNGFADLVQVTSPSMPGMTFTPATFSLTPGSAQPVTLQAHSIAPIGTPNEVSFTGTAAGVGTHSAPLFVTVLAPEPRLTAISAPATTAGTRDQRFRVTGEALQNGAFFAFDDPRIRVHEATVVRPTLADIVVTVHSDTPPGAYPLHVTNPDGGRSATGVPLFVYPPSSLAAPLGVSAAAIVFPSFGSSVATGESVYPRGLLATTGAGTIIGSWQLDGVPFDRFTAIVSGGLPVEVRTHAPIPATYAGRHRLELVIESPAHVVAPSIDIFMTSARASRLTLLAPDDGAVIAPGPSLFRWSLVPNCAGSLVEVVDEASARSGVPVDLLPVHRFRLSNSEWRPTARDIDQIGFGIRRWRVSPVCAGETIAEPTQWRRFAFLPESVTLTLASLAPAGDGKLAVRWSGGLTGLLYRVEVLGSDGSLLFAALTARMEYVFDLAKFTPPAGSSIRVTAIAPGGAVLGTSVPLAVSRSRERDSAIRRAQFTPFSLLQTEPRDGARIASVSPRVSASWREAVRPDQVSMTIDQTDVTFVSTITPTSIAYDALLPLDRGEHTVRLSVATQITTWRFTIEPEVAAEKPAAPGEPPAKKEKTTMLRSDWLVSPVGTLTLVRDQNDEAHLRISAQTDLAGAVTSMKVTGDVGIRHERGDPRRTVQESRSWVTRFGAHRGTNEQEVTIGYSQPDFMDQAQLVSTGFARGGAQAKVKSRFGSFSYYQTFSTRPVGVVAGNIGPEQKLRAFALQAPPHANWDFRIIALGVEDEAGFNSAGGEGSALGIFTRYTFSTAASLVVEAARGRFEPNPESAVPDREGNAFRAALSGVTRSLSYTLNVRRTSADFVNPANRGFTAGGVPDRSGGDLVLSRMFGRSSLTAQVRYLRDGTSSGQLLPSTSERGAVVSLTTMLGTRTSLSLSGNLTAQKGDAAPAISLPKTDRRQSGLSATFSESFGRFVTSQTLQWQKMDDDVSELARQTIKAATFTGSGTLSETFTISSFLSATRSEGVAAIGRTDQLLGSIQPMINIPRIWFSLHPRAMWGRTESSLTGFVARTEQYAALFTLAPPLAKSLFALQFSTDWSRNRFTGQIENDGFTRRYAATVSFGRSLGNIAAPSSTPGAMPYLPPDDPQSGMTPR